MRAGERIRYGAMYVTSAGIGYVMGAVLWAAGMRWSVPMRELVRRTARQHAGAAARREGSYLAPVTLLLIIAGLIGFASGVIMVIGWWG